MTAVRKAQVDASWQQSAAWVAPFTTKLNELLVRRFYNDDDYDEVKAYLIATYGTN